MRILRGLLGALLWIVASVLGLVAVLLCVTVILLPVGFPLLMVARRLFGQAIGLMLPRKVAHPVKEGRKAARRNRPDVAPDKVVPDTVSKASRKLSKKARKQAGDKVEQLTGRKSRVPFRR